VAAGLVAGSLAWWHSSAVASEQQAQAEASAKASADAKKKADDLATYLSKLAEDNRTSAAQEEARAAQAAQDRAAADAKGGRQASVKGQMEAQGWHQFSGYLYYKYADDSKYTCSVLGCTYILVASMAPNGCPGGFYVEASIERGSLSVGLANGVTAALPRAKLQPWLEDSSGTGGGNAFHLSVLTCHGG
jgi:rubrerythrin